ncbi:hypothetical protein [Butyrivibrio sp. WCE2006]|uniref:hypothetical protein n=1 Tax=Butyrivibrio sp. WCE2006 TaxID=1410611 RepID=UPI0005D13A9F|nr:hypothetical protein [Butyrivibrio sp. WCE2006]
MHNELFENESIPKAYMKMALPVVMGMVITLVYPQALQTLCRQGVVFLPMIILLSSFLGLNGIIATQFISDLLTTVIAFILLKCNILNENR